MQKCTKETDNKGVNKEKKTEILAMICARHKTIIFDDLLLAIA